VNWIERTPPTVAQWQGQGARSVRQTAAINKWYNVVGEDAAHKFVIFCGEEDPISLNCFASISSAWPN
jgi:hypothetical protein